MARTQQRVPRRTAGRRTRIPPALIRGPESLPGAPVLDEVPGDLGVALWTALRNVTTWASTPPARRGGLFAVSAAARREEELSGLEIDAELVAPLSVMVRLLENPVGMELTRLVNACRRIALWAEQRGHLGTALEWAQAAAVAAPQSAGLAYAVGRLARRRAEYDRAESWYARAIVQARRTRDWRTYVLGYSGLGNMNTQKGNFPMAKRAQMRGLRAALRHDLRDLQGIAYHDLFVTQLETGGGTEATALAAQAFRAYGPEHPYVPRLAFDVAYHWILEGCFADALPVALALRPCFDGAAEQALVLSMVTRSAGGAGDRAAFDQARRELVEMLDSGCGTDVAARALLGISHGAASLKEWPLAESMAQQALQIATERREGRMVIAAEAALEFARSHPEPPRQTRLAAPHAGLADEFVQALRERPVPAGAGTD
jgi:tetratricopeptide (TPR) repeat protein